MGAKFVAGVLACVVMIGLSIAVMIYGWGLKPQSWWWILGGGVGLRLLLAVMEHVAKDNRK